MVKLQNNRTHEISANRGIWSSLANVRVFSAHQEITAKQKVTVSQFLQSE